MFKINKHFDLRPSAIIERLDMAKELRAGI